MFEVRTMTNRKYVVFKRGSLPLRKAQETLNSEKLRLGLHALLSGTNPSTTNT